MYACLKDIKYYGWKKVRCRYLPDEFHKKKKFWMITKDQDFKFKKSKIILSV